MKYKRSNTTTTTAKDKKHKKNSAHTHTPTHPPIKTSSHMAASTHTNLLSYA